MLFLSRKPFCMILTGQHASSVTLVVSLMTIVIGMSEMPLHSQWESWPFVCVLLLLLLPLLLLIQGNDCGFCAF
jgi:hypothetical protein